MHKLLLIISIVLNFYSDISICRTEGTNLKQISRFPASPTLCSKIFDIQPQSLISVEDAETIKTYIFQGPIINFYLRNIKNPNNAVIAKSLFEANNLDEVKVQKFLGNLDRVLAQQGLTKEREVVYRGEGRKNDESGSIHVGARLEYENYISTTRDKELAMGFANGTTSDLKIFYEITIERGQPGAQINLLAPEGVRNQDEFLLARNSFLIVNEIHTIDGVTYIKASYETRGDYPFDTKNTKK